MILVARKLQTKSKSLGQGWGEPIGVENHFIKVN